MSNRTQKRFWKQTAVADASEGFAIELDGRQVKTPAKAALLLPNRAMADAVAAEWDAQEAKIDPLSMPVTRSANAAIDKVRHQHGEVAAMLVAYGDTDLLCYRAEAPEALVARQAELWDPALDWAHETLGARLTACSGVLHQPQDASALERLAAPVYGMTEFQLAGFHDLVSLSGSLVLGLAAARDWRAAEALWDLSRLDEKWQAEQWGADEEAETLAQTKRQAFLHAKRFFDLCTATER